MNSLPAMVADWTAEAVREHGFDWTKISSHLRKKIKSLPPEERIRFEREAALTVSCQPSKSSGDYN